jgi:hypothetical protein
LAIQRQKGCAVPPFLIGTGLKRDAVVLNRELSILEAKAADADRKVSGVSECELARFLTFRWGTSESNRRVRFYSLTALGRKRIQRESKEFDRLLTKHVESSGLSYEITSGDHSWQRVGSYGNDQ